MLCLYMGAVIDCCVLADFRLVISCCSQSKLSSSKAVMSWQANYHCCVSESMKHLEIPGMNHRVCHVTASGHRTKSNHK